MSAKRGTFWGGLLLCVFLGALYLIPRTLKTRDYQLNFPAPQRKALHNISPNLSLPWVVLPNHIEVMTPQEKLMSRVVSLPLKRFYGKKKSLLINFWATWCRPCVEEMPALEKLHRRLSQSDNPRLPELVTISVDESVEPIHQLFETLGFTPTFPVLFDASGQKATELGTTRFPETYWVDENGQVLELWVGPQNWVSQQVLDILQSHTP